jgi:hypothetical protein
MKTRYTLIKLLYATDGWNNFNMHSNGNMLEKEEEFNRRRPTSTPQTTNMSISPSKQLGRKGYFKIQLIIL